MRIGIDARMYGTKATTGIGAYIKELTDNLFSLDAQNEYYIFLLPEVFDNFKTLNPRVKKIKVDFPWYSWQEQIFFPRVIKKNRIDLMHFPQFNVPLFYNKKFVVTIHDVTPRLFPGPIVKKSLVRRLGFNLTFNHALKKSKTIITISNHTKDNIKKYFKVDEKKIKVIHLGFNNKYQKITDHTLLDVVKKKYSITKPFLFYVGVWRDHKNIESLIKAFDILKIKGSDYQLVLTGKAQDNYPEIPRAINQSKYKQDIITPGFVNEQDLILLYNAATLFVLPSFAEGFGLVALESLACGTPVVASNTTSLPEVLEDSAIYFNPEKPEEIYQAIDKVLSDQDLYENLKNLGIQRIKSFDWNQTARATLDVYRKC